MTRVMTAIAMHQIAELHPPAPRVISRRDIGVCCRDAIPISLPTRPGIAGDGDRAEVIFKATRVDGVYVQIP
jgi:hypothetical protein